MKLYYSKGACSLAVRIILNETELDAEFEAVNLKTKVTETNINFLTINPKGSVPVLEIKPNKILTENVVILQYLCDISNATELLPPVGDMKRYRVLEWLNYITSELHKSIGILFNPVISEDLKEQIFIPLVKTKLDYINNQLANSSYLLGEEFTLPDAYLFVVLRWTHTLQIDLKGWAHLTKFFNKAHTRESVQTALKTEGIQ